jgi:hypothetical protein
MHIVVQQEARLRPAAQRARYGITHLKLAASSILPVPWYLATSG